jgi:hypothetical protein
MTPHIRPYGRTDVRLVPSFVLRLLFLNRCVRTYGRIILYSTVSIFLLVCFFSYYLFLGDAILIATPSFPPLSMRGGK